jgi:Na+/pantothenate symporter
MKKSPFLAAVINMLIPGSCHLYTEKNWKKAVSEFIVGIVLWVGLYLVSIKFHPLLILLCPVLLFIDGFSAANQYNRKLEATQP